MNIVRPRSAPHLQQNRQASETIACDSSKYNQLFKTRNNLMNNPITRYIFAVNVPAGGGLVWVGRQLFFLRVSGSASLGCVGVTLLFLPFSKSL